MKNRVKTTWVKLLVFISFSLHIFLFSSMQLKSQCVDCNSTSTPGLNASAIGNGNTAAGNYSFVGGFNSSANGTTSFAFGNRVIAGGASSFAMGRYLRTTTSPAIVIGTGFNMDNPLINSIPNSFMVGFNSNLPTFIVSDAWGMNLTGRIGIGNVTSPEAKLHIRADEGEDADLMLQATGAGKKAELLFDGGLGIISNMDRSAPLQFYAGAGKFLGIHLDGESGLVGIGTDNPTAQLDIGGSLRIRGGNPGAGKVLTTDAEGYATWQTPSGGGGGSNWEVIGNNIYREGGYVGIGTDNPRDRLSIDSPYGKPINFHIGGTQSIYSNAYYDGSTKRAEQGPAYSITFTDSRMRIRVAGNGAANSNINWDEVMSITPDGLVGIGTSNPHGYKLAVNGKMITEEVVVKLRNNWPDYVFEESYALKPLDELGSFIDANGHLPEVPTAQQVAEDGLSLGEMNALLLKKIEELTLYTLQQQKEIDALKQQMAK